MKKMLLLLMGMLSFPFMGTGQENPMYPLQGRVTSSADSLPLIGASVVIQGGKTGTVTDIDGQFSLNVPEGTSALTVSYIGYITEEIQVTPPLDGPLSIGLVESLQTLSEVEVASTGYQQLPKERATGSFAQIDNQLLNRSVSTNVLDRLEDVTPGVAFNRIGSVTQVSIRGRSTLLANAEPLVIVDNFPYDGDIGNINPNDVESVTVLKDAAAASIWGARAGNGVIVITTKQGERNQRPQVSFNANVTVGERPDPFYVPQMSVSSFIDTERALFGEGFYDSYETALDRRPLSPVLELLIARRDGLLSAEEAEAQIEALGQQDVRRDFRDYFYRESINQQYNASVQGGSGSHRYFFSAGYDHNLENMVGNGFQRVTLNAKNSWSFLDNKLQFTGDLYYANSEGRDNGTDPGSIRMSSYSVLPFYARLADGAGSPLPVMRDYRAGFLDGAEANGLLNWRYSPLAEMELVDKTTRSTDYRANFSISYRLSPSLNASVLYQYWNSQSTGQDHYPLESYYARNLVNAYTQANPDGSLYRPIPLGGILDRRDMASSSHNARAQLNYGRTFNGRHEVHAMAGYEVKGLVTEGARGRYYGYDGELANSAPVDYVTRFPQYHYPARSYAIQDYDNHTSLTDRFVSYYANASYTYARRYIISASGRKDQSNLFGVEANQRGVPLWSAGLGWNLHEEAFYRWEWMPYLKLRATYGYSGNIDKGLSAYTTAYIVGNSPNTGLLYARISNPPNPELQWERIRMQNFAVDFETRNGRLSGSMEYFTKQGKDLIGFAPLSPATGRQQFKGNVASTRGKGMDLSFLSRNIDGGFTWDTHWLFSHAVTEVEDYENEPSTSLLLTFGDRAVYPVEGHAPVSVYSYAWAGLNPDNGNPRGYLNGEISEDYAGIINGATPDSLIYHGPAQPTSFGAIRNTFRWKNISLSVNISYRLGYYFRSSSINYGNQLGLGGHGDYDQRWQQPGDEAFTQVPSIPETVDYQRDRLYTYSEALVDRGDHVRLQDINLSYTLDKNNFPGLPFQQVQVYGYARNFGILWKATDKVPDPDYRFSNALRSYALGIRASF